MKSIVVLFTILICLVTYQSEASIEKRNVESKITQEMAGIVPLFDFRAIGNALQEYADAMVEKEIQALQWIGEEFVTKARDKQALGTRQRPAPGEGFWDQTGNLRSSIGYIIVNNGRIIDKDLKKVRGGDEGYQKAESFAREKAGEFRSGLVLIVFAGMEYAASAESKGYDVISGSAPTQQYLRDAFEQFGLR